MSCVDPASFVGGGPTLATFFFFFFFFFFFVVDILVDDGERRLKYHLKRPIIDPPAKRSFNRVLSPTLTSVQYDLPYKQYSMIYLSSFTVYLQCKI